MKINAVSILIFTLLFSCKSTESNDFINVDFREFITINSEMKTTFIFDGNRLIRVQYVVKIKDDIIDSTMNLIYIDDKLDSFHIFNKKVDHFLKIDYKNKVLIDNKTGKIFDSAEYKENFGFRIITTGYTDLIADPRKPYVEDTLYYNPQTNTFTSIVKYQNYNKKIENNGFLTFFDKNNDFIGKFRYYPDKVNLVVEEYSNQETASGE